MQPHASLLLYAALSVAGLVLLIVYFKVSAFLALIIASIFMGTCAGLNPLQTLKAFETGVGAVLSSIAVIIGLGTIFGKIFAESGGADVISERLMNYFGPNRLPWAFLVISFLAGLPVFFGVGLVLMIPIVYVTARQHQLSLLALGLPMVAGLSAAHGFVPPHPGPLAAIEFLGANLGKTILFSLPVALVSGIVAGPILIRFLRLPQVSIPDGYSPAPQERPISFPRAISVIALPILLMTIGTVARLWLTPNSFSLRMTELFGHPIMAMLVGCFFAYSTCAGRFSRQELLKLSEESLGPIAIILLVIGAGGGFSRVLIESGAGTAIAALATQWKFAALPMGYMLAVLLRVATGSATVAITTSAALVKPVADAQPGTNLELLVLAMGAGSLILSHVNDGGFWLVKSYLNISVGEALKTWTVLETVLSITAFAMILLLNLVF